MFYCVDTTTGKRTSLGTANEDEARQIIEAKNNSDRQPVLNLQIAKAYLAGSDNGMTTRTWQNAIEVADRHQTGSEPASLENRRQGQGAGHVAAASHHRNQGRTIVERPANAATVSTNVYLRRLHNFCVDMNWLPWPLVPKRQWPAVEFKEKRAHHFGRTSGDCRPREQSRTQGVLQTGVVFGRVAIRLGIPSGRGC